MAYIIAFILHARYAKKIEPELYPLKMFISPLLQILVFTGIYYATLDLWIIRWGILVLYLVAILFKERFRIGILIPRIADKCSFFRKN